MTRREKITAVVLSVGASASIVGVGLYQSGIVLSKDLKGVFEILEGDIVEILFESSTLQPQGSCCNINFSRTKPKDYIFTHEGYIRHLPVQALQNSLL